MTTTTTSRTVVPYIEVIAPPALFVVVATLLEIALRARVGSESAAQLAPGLAAIPSVVLGAWLARRGVERDVDADASASTSQGQGQRLIVSPPTRVLLILVAALGFMVADLLSELLGDGSIMLIPISNIDNVDDATLYNLLAMRSIVVFLVLCVVVATPVSLRLRTNRAQAFVIATVLYIVGNSVQNILRGGDVVNAQYIAWTFGYIAAAFIAQAIGTAIARRRQAGFDAAQLARTRARRSRSSR